MEGISVDYFPKPVDPGIKEIESEFNSYISDENEQDICDSHDHMVHLFKINNELGILVSGISPVWEDTDGFTKQ